MTHIIEVGSDSDNETSVTFKSSREIYNTSSDKHHKKHITGGFHTIVIGLATFIISSIIVGGLHMIEEFYSDYFSPAILYIFVVVLFFQRCNGTPKPSIKGFWWLLLCIVLGIVLFVGNFYLMDSIVIESRKGISHIALAMCLIVFQSFFTYTNSGKIKSIVWSIILGYACFFLFFTMGCCMSSGMVPQLCEGQYLELTTYTNIAVLAGIAVILSHVCTVWDELLNTRNSSKGKIKIIVLLISFFILFFLVFTPFGLLMAGGNLAEGAMKHTFYFIAVFFVINAIAKTSTNMEKFAHLGLSFRTMLTSLFSVLWAILAYFLSHAVLFSNFKETSWINSYDFVFFITWATVVVVYVNIFGEFGLVRMEEAVICDECDQVVYAKTTKRSAAVTESEAQYLRELAEKAHRFHLNENEISILLNLIGLRDVRINEVMTPRTVVYSLSADMYIRDIVESKTSILRFSRIPLYQQEDKSNIVGWIHRNEILEAVRRKRHDKKIGHFMHKLIRCSSQLPVISIMARMIHLRQHMFVVMDEFDTFEGVVSLEDILEEILGTEIVDEHDKVVDMRALARKRHREMNNDSSTDSDTEEEDIASEKSTFSDADVLVAVIESPKMTPGIIDQEILEFDLNEPVITTKSGTLIETVENVD
ncbi:hypothetical protein PCE1_003577 [Barthelona sp. PCE]